MAGADGSEVEVRKEGRREGGKVRNLARNVFWLGGLEWQVAWQARARAGVVQVGAISLAMSDQYLRGI